MAVPPLVLGAVLLFLAWRTREPAWRMVTAALGFGCVIVGGYVVATDPRAFTTNARPGEMRRLGGAPTR